MVTYLGQLVLDKDLEQVDLVLKFLHRWVKVMSSFTALCVHMHLSLSYIPCCRLEDAYIY